MLKRFVRFSAIAIATVFTASTIPASAQQTWPTRAITMIVPFAAGGPIDTIGRIMAARMSELLGQQIVIDNIGGAGGMNGSARAAKAAPDGYTLLLASSAVLALNQTLYEKPLYNAVTDFEPVTLFSDSARVLLARKDLPANNFKEFIAYAKANHSKMQYGTAGAGSGTHVCALMLDLALGTKITHVPYRGAGPAMQDLLAGRIDFIAEQISTAITQIRADRAKALVTFGSARAPGLEDVPTAEELGVQGLDCSSWAAFAYPRGTPNAIVERIAKASNDALETPAVRERLNKLGVTVTPANRRGPEYLAKYIKSEIERWAGPIKASGVIIKSK